jgi:hypothetical protein
LTERPQVPLGVSLQVRPAGVIRIIAYYLPSVDGVYAANQWAITYTINGFDPTPDSPTITPDMSASGLAVLQYDLPAVGGGTVVKVLAQTRRTVGLAYRYSLPGAVYSAIADDTGPSVPIGGDKWRGALPEDV